MEFRNITIKGDNNTFNKAIFSKDFNQDENGYTWLNPKAIKLVDSKYTSFELSWDPIEGAESYVLVLIDYDANKVFGFPFLHWAVANITTTTLEASANLNNTEIIQGLNSSAPKMKDDMNGIYYEALPSGYRSSSFENAIGFFPMLSREKPHMFMLTIIGLDTKTIDINSGFFLDDLSLKIQKSIVGVHYKSFWFKGN